MTININQFALSTVQGKIDLQFGGSVVSCQVDSSQATDIVAGQAVKLADVASGVPKVVSLAADTDASFGIALYNIKDQAYSAYEMLEVAIAGSVVYMTASGAISRGAPVEFTTASNKVSAWGGVNPIIGTAFDKASADGDLIRVYIINPAANTSVVKTINVTATLAEINAGKVLIAGTAGKAITVTGFTQRVAGNFATTTSVDIQSTNATPVKVAVAAVAALTAGAVLTSAPSANVTLGAGFSVPLGAGDGLKVVNTGTAATGGTSIIYTINYIQA